MGRLGTLALAGLLLTGAAGAQTPHHERRQPAGPENGTLEAILQGATAAPPELAADLLLETVEKGLVKDKIRRVEVLHEAFDLAAGAKFPLQLITTGAGKSQQTDTDAGVLSGALGSRTDTLSLRMRAIDEMVRLNAAEALEMFEQVPLPQVPSLSCKNALGYAFDDYYETIGLLYKSAFGPAARAKRMDLDFLETHLVSLGSPFELLPAAHLLCEANLSHDAMMETVSSYAQNLSNLKADDRSFTAATNYSFLDVVYELSKRAKSSGVSNYGLVSALGAYIDEQLRAVRCADNANSPFIKGVVDQFNTRFRKAGPDVEKVPAIPADDLNPTNLGGNVEVYSFWDKSAARALMAEYKRLRFGSAEEQAEPNSPPTVRDNMAPYLGLNERKSDQWSERANTFLKNLDEWEVKSEPGTASFHEKCIMYSALLEIVPKGEFRRRVFLEYLTFLRNSPVETDSPPEWFLHLNRLLKMRYEEDKSGFSKDIAQLGDATMQLYAQLTELASPK